MRRNSTFSSSNDSNMSLKSLFSIDSHHGPGINGEFPNLRYPLCHCARDIRTVVAGLFKCFSNDNDFARSILHLSNCINILPAKPGPTVDSHTLSFEAERTAMNIGLRHQDRSIDVPYCGSSFFFLMQRSRAWNLI